MRRFINEWGWWMPGVSMKIIWESGVVRMPVMRLRVVCGLGVTMATFSPKSWFSKVDFPTLGRPTMAMYPERNEVSASSLFLPDDFAIDFKLTRHYYDMHRPSFKIATIKFHRDVS